LPIRPERRFFYPIDWAIISRQIRFGRAKGRCETCGRPHGRLICQLNDGRWFDDLSAQWRDDRGEPVAWPDIVDLSGQQRRKIFLGTAHLDQDPGNSRPTNLKALCQRCHLRHDRTANILCRRLRLRARRAIGDLFAGPHPII
jgi:ribosomal protein S14